MPRESREVVGTSDESEQLDKGVVQLDQRVLQKEAMPRAFERALLPFFLRPLLPLP